MGRKGPSTSRAREHQLDPLSSLAVEFSNGDYAGGQLLVIMSLQC